MRVPTVIACLALTLLFRPAVGAAQAVETVPLPFWGTGLEIDLTEFNARLPRDAPWARDPLLVVSRLVAGWPQNRSEDGEFREMWDSTSSDIEIVFADGDSPDGARVTVLRDGFGDDSVRGDAHRIELRRQADEAWQPVAAEVFRHCWRGDVTDRFVAESCP